MLKISLLISGIGEIKDNKIQVVFDDGKTAWLSRQTVEFFPGRIVVPLWLAQKIRPYPKTQPGELS